MEILFLPLNILSMISSELQLNRQKRLVISLHHSDVDFESFVVLKELGNTVANLKLDT